MDNVQVPVSTVANLSNVFGDGSHTKQFVTRYLRAHHAELFFADAVILVEGAAERMMLPQFLRTHFKFLDQCYISILDIGGSHAHRLRPLIDALGIVTLVITDLDAGKAKAAHPARWGADLSTTNPTLKHWLRTKNASVKVDNLLRLPEDQKWEEIDELFAIRVAYQTPISVQLPSLGPVPVEVLANTFEDSLVLSNAALFSENAGRGLLGRFSRALQAAKTADKLADDLFDALRDGNKGEFSLEVLGNPKFAALTVPQYIREGLEWLESKLRKKQSELVLVAATPDEVQP
jgi:hypothetical protein